MKILNKSLFLISLFSLSLLLAPVYVRANDDVEDDEDAVINDESQAGEDIQTASESEADEGTASEEGGLTSSPYAKTNILFVKPETSDLPAGRLARLLIAFKNNGSTPFLVETIDGSFRYPQDFSYHIQNFSTYHFNKLIEPEREATFEYLFTPSETFSSRQFGFTINLRYKNVDGKSFVNAVFNDTINVVEPDEGLDGETFFLYIFLGAIVLLVAVGGNHLLAVFRKKGSRSGKHVAPKVTNGNSTTDGVDYEWIPKEHLQQNKSPRVSPRQRRVKNGGGNAVSSSGNSSNDE